VDATLERRLRPLDGAPTGSLVLHEIYASIQGESTWAGLPCVFVRTTACHLRCRWCDTPHAFTQGKPWALADVLAEIERHGLELVELTGGEPLLQPGVLGLMTTLCDRGYTVLLETSGSLDIGPVDPRVVKIVDLKAPGSGEEAANRYDNLAKLGARDEVKVVLADRADYDWAKAQLTKYSLGSRPAVLFSTVFGQLDPRELARWIVEDRLPVRLQLQQHKYIWDPKARGV
jgi:7-carboxy-7-deazaguanine synthase